MKTNSLQSRTISVSHSVAILPEDAALSRKPRFGWRARPEKFYDGFEQKIVFYDCFWHADGKRVLLVGPPPRNLLPILKQARYSTDNSPDALIASFHISQSVMILELVDVPAGAKTITICASGMNFELEIQPNYSDFLADKRIMFTLSKDNDLDWISAWADYYHHFHGVNAIVLVDNGSTKTTLVRLALALKKTKIEHIFILSMPYIYGAIDRAVVFNPYWTHFLQIAVMSIVLRRFAASAEGLINCDIDELMTLNSQNNQNDQNDVFADLNKTPNGLLSMRGQWVEPYSAEGSFGDHRDFVHQLMDEKLRAYKQRKWVLDPKKPWVQDLNVHPYMHWIEGRPGGAKTTSQDAYYWHFKGINNNWKTNRNTAENTLPANMELDQKLVDRFAQWLPDYKPSKSEKPE